MNAVELTTRVAVLNRTVMRKLPFVPALAGASALLCPHASCAPLAGTVVQWGEYAVPLVEPGTRFKAIASGFDYTFLAVKMDGTVVGWGRNGYGEASPPPGLSNVVAIAEATHSVALKSDGSVSAWGDNSMGQLGVPLGLSNVVAISAATTHTLALKRDGTVAAWGDNFANESTVPRGLSNVTAVAAGVELSLALLSNGTIFDIGQNTNVMTASNVITIVTSGVSRSDPNGA
jgi:alpha-tubulin suppressor-like RCC1 family protein